MSVITPSNVVNSSSSMGRAKSPRNAQDYKLPNVERVCLDDNWVLPKFDQTLRLEVAQLDDRDVILEFLLNEFGTQETLNRTLEISKSDLLDSIDQTLVSSIARGLTIIAVNNNRLCGVIANNWSVVDRSHSQEIRIKKDYGNDLDQDNSYPSKVRYINVILKQLESFSPNFLPTDCHQCFRIDLVSVRPKYAGCGIGKRLFLESFKLAERLGFQFCETVCTATASTKIALSVGMKTAFVFPYSEYRSHGSAVFQKSMHDGCVGASLMIGDVNEVLQKL
ncbi:hypothetical protein M3Y94_00182700 [Aphelenchoides besseyi]|nr:hypothetical protein M3Y94_00182700 [Aphelenchoides besseyi]KAI6236868.1 Acetyltransferase, GNAT family [Aphelenchoides besseyi]